MTASDAQTHVFAMRMWKSLLATQELLSAYLGVKLGLYEALAAAPGPMRPDELARAAGVAPGTPGNGWSTRPSAASSKPMTYACRPNTARTGFPPGTPPS